MNITPEAIEAAQKALDAAVDSHLPDAFSTGCEANGTECEDEYDCLWDMARLAIEAAAPAIQAAALREAADHIAEATPYNLELKPDGSEDPRAAAYVQGIDTCLQTLNTRADQLGAKP